MTRPKVAIYNLYWATYGGGEQVSGAIAETIIERAREAGVYVHESTELVALLMKVDLDQRIPPQLYVAVAELLAWLYQIEAAGGKPAAPPANGGLTAPRAPPAGLPAT